MDCGGLGTAVLVMAHIPQAAAAYTAIRRHFHVVAASLVVSAVASCAYHTYDCLDYATADKATRSAWHTAQVEAFVLQAANFAAVATSAFCKHNTTITAYSTVAAFAAAVYAFSWGADARYGMLAAIPAATGAAFWAKQFANWRARRTGLPPPPPTATRRADTTARMTLAAVAGIAVAIVGEAVLDANDNHLYYAWHALWHVGTGVAMLAALKAWPPVNVH